MDGAERAAVLIVDDDRVLLQALPETVRLRMGGVEVDIAEDAASALEQIRTGDYDAIVSDIKMPGMDGLELLGRLHELAPEIPTLLITGHGEQELTVEALRRGAYDFIQKPIDREYFIASLRRAIQVRQLRRSLARHTDQLERIVEERTSALRVLAEAGRSFAASFDAEATLAALTRMSVPRLADVCVAFLLREDGTVRRVEAAHLDPDREAELRDWITRNPYDPFSIPPLAGVLDTGGSLLAADVGAVIDQHTMPAPIEGLLRFLALRSAMVIPLVARGRILGAVALGATTRSYAAEDLDFAESLAQRAALSIDNVRLYEHERSVAETLQRSLLPRSLPTLPGIAVAARYLPASPEAVGGDWYDLFRLPGGRMGLVMGDVAGRGVRVASVMGQLRNALRAYALEGYAPDVVMKHLSRVIDAGEMATVLYLIFDPTNWQVMFASAGHPPPLVIAPDGSARFLEGGSPPLGGLRPHVYLPLTDRLVPGSTVVLYTDGLIERRRTPIDEGLSRLAHAAVQGNGDLERLLDRILQGVVQDGVGSDDVALLALRALPLDDARLVIRLPAEPGSVPQIRHALRRWLHQAGVDPKDAYEMAVACCEACSNAVEHAYGLLPGDLQVEAAFDGDGIGIAVTDWGQWRPSRGHNRGRGLPLVDVLMDSVDVTPSPQGTRVAMRRRLQAELLR